MNKFATFTTAAILACLASSAAAFAASKPAYFIIEVDVKDSDGFNSYAEKATEMVTRYGGTFVVMGGRVRSVEGAPPAGNVVVIRFDDYDLAERWLDSEEYARIKTMRHESAETRQILAEGLEWKTLASVRRRKQRLTPSDFAKAAGSVAHLR